jgi:hypothetical protein
VNVAAKPLYVTAPATAVPPGPVTVKLDEVIEEGFIAMLKVALIAVLIATAVAPLAGMVDTTDGTVTVSCPHPAMKTTNRNAKKHVIPILYLRICTLSSNLGAKVPKARAFTELMRNAHTTYPSKVNKNRFFRLYKKAHSRRCILRLLVQRHILLVRGCERRSAIRISS